MPTFSLLALSVVDNGNMRIILLTLILIAVALILGGCAIAVFTLKQQQESKIFHTDRNFRE